MRDFKISDAHVHFGSCGLTGLTVNEKSLMKYLQSVENALVFPLDRDLDDTNRRLIPFLSECRSAKRRIYGLARFQIIEYLKKDEAFKDILSSPKILGVKFHPSFDRLPIIHPFFSDILYYLNERGLIILVHCGRWQDVSHCSFAFQIAETFPALHIIIAHMGGNEYSNSIYAIKLAKTHHNVYLDTSNCRMPSLIEEAVKALGDKRILFGSDIPWGSLRPNIYTVLDASVSYEAKQNILHNNLADLIDKVK